MTTNQRPTKTQRRAAAEAAAAQAARRKRRIQAIAGAVTGLAVFAVIFAGFFLLQNDDADGAASPALTTTPIVASEEPTAAPSPTAPAAAAADFPPVPEGADPALRQQPTVTAGKGELTKLVVTPIIEGTGAAVASGQTITVNYVGVTYADGKEFDSSWNARQTAEFPIGVGQVIPGWDQGLVGVKVGSRVQLDIPANLAYGDNASGGAPAGPLRFVVDVLAAQ